MISNSEVQPICYFKILMISFTEVSLPPRGNNPQRACMDPALPPVTFSPLRLILEGTKGG
jgi:hypothetical protein